MIEGISHITFIVKDLAATSRFWEGVFGAKEIYASGKRAYSLYPEKFYDLDGLWICIMEGEESIPESYNHIAFKTSDAALPEYRRRIQSLGLVLRPERRRVEGEGQSLYFYDYDNHLFELHTGTLTERLARYLP